MRVFVAIGNIGNNRFHLLVGGLQFEFFHQSGQQQAQCHALLGAFGKHIGRQIKARRIQALLCKVLLHFVCQALRFVFHKNFGQIKRMCAAQSCHHGIGIAGIHAAFHFTRHVFLDFFAHFCHVAIGNAQGFGKIGIHFGQLGLGNIVHGDGEHGGFACYVFAVVIRREVYFHVFAFAFFQAQHACFKFRQHFAIAQQERIVFRRTACKRLSVDFAFKVDNHAVAVLRGALHAVIAGALFAQDFNGVVHFFVAHFGAHFFNV